MYGSRAQPLEPGERSGSDSTLPPAVFTWRPNIWDDKPTSWIELEAQDSVAAGGTGAVQLRVDSGGLLLRQWTVGLPADTDWHRQRLNLSGIPLTSGTDYRVEWVAATTLKIRNAVVRHVVGTPGAPDVQNPCVGQAVGDGRTLALWPLYPLESYAEGAAEQPRYPVALPTGDRSWVALNGSTGTASGATWAEVPDATLWQYRPDEWGGAVDFTLQVVAAGDYGGTGIFSQWLVGLFYAGANELIPGSLVEVEGNDAGLRVSGSFQLRGNEPVVAKVIRYHPTSAALTITSVRLQVTSTGGSSTPMLRSCALEPLLLDAGTVTGKTWEDRVQNTRPRVAGSVDSLQYLEATLARSGSAGNAELQLVNRATATVLTTLTESGATAALVRSGDIRGALETDGILLDSPEASRDWQAGLDLRGDGAGVVGEARTAHLATVTRHDPVSDEVSVAGGWLLDLADADLDLTADWALDTEQDLDLTAAWSLDSGLDVDLTAAWAVATTSDVDLTAAWVLDLAALDVDLSAQWALQATLDSDLAGAWVVAAPVDLDAPAAWLVAFTSDLDLTAGWAMIAQLDLPAGWGIDAPDQDLDLAAAWALQPSIDLDLAAAWSLQPTLDLDLTAAWSLDAGLDVDLVGSWVLYGEKDVDLAAAWAVNGRQQLDLSAQWLVAAPTFIQGQGAWLLRVTVDADLSAAWQVAATPDLDLAAAWAIGPVAFDLDLQAAWQISEGTDVDLAAAWNVYRQTDVDLAAAWGVVYVRADDVDLPAAWATFRTPDLDLAAAWAIYTADLDVDLTASWRVAPPPEYREEVTSTIALTTTVDSAISLTEALDSTITAWSVLPFS